MYTLEAGEPKVQQKLLIELPFLVSINFFSPFLLFIIKESPLYGTQNFPIFLLIFDIIPSLVMVEQIAARWQ